MACDALLGNRLMCEVQIADVPNAPNKSLELRDKDPYDYARVIRVFPESRSVTIHFRIHAGQNSTGRLEIELTARFGYRPVRLISAEDGQIKVLNGADLIAVAPYQSGQWNDLALKSM